MGAGKTTIGKELSALMKCSFIDLDFFIERRYHKTIRQIFEEKGEATFRELEHKMLREVAEFEDVIISTGGGTPCFFQNMQFMNAFGTTIYLKVSNKELVRRIQSHKSTRPMLKNLTGDDLIRFVDETMSKRQPHYEQAKIVYATEITDNSTDAASLLRLIQKND
jgi:shikimate kinase